MSSVVRSRILLAGLAFLIVGLSANLERVQTVFAQSPFPTPVLFPTPEPFPTPFGTPPGPLITPTATPDFRIVNEIIHPQSGDAVSGITAIVGTAVVNDFVEFQVHISPAGADNWSWLSTNKKVVRSGILYALNTYQLKDGLYDLRVRAIKRDGNYSEAFLRNVEVRNASPPTATPNVNAEGTPQPDSPLLPVNIQPPTPTPTPVFQSYVVNGQGIFEPKNGDILRGAAPVVGTVNGKTYLNPFERYELYIAPTGTAEWSWLYTGEDQLWQSPIYSLDTTLLADGDYDLRLRIVYRDGNYDEYYVSRLRVANQTPSGALSHQVSQAGTEPGLYFPLDNAHISGNLQIVGTTDVPNLLRWEIYWSPSGSGDWRFLVSDTRPLVDSTLANLDLSLLPQGMYDFRLRIVRRDYGHTDYDVHNVRTTPPTPTPIPTAPVIR